MANADPLPIFARLHTLRDTLRQLVAELHIVAERAELFATPRKSRPRLMPSGTPQLERHQEHLARLHEQARIALDRESDPVAANLFELLTAAGERPPRPVLNAAYTFAAVLEVVRVVRSVGWGGGGRLRDARDPWERITPAERLSRRELWEWGEVPLPYFGDPAVVAEFNAALTREFARAERAAECEGRQRGEMALAANRRRTWPPADPDAVTRHAGTARSGRNRHSASEAVRGAVLEVFGANEVLAFAEVFKRLGGDRGDWSDGHVRRALSHLAKADDGRLRRVGNGRYARAGKNL